MSWISSRYLAGVRDLDTGEECSPLCHKQARCFLKLYVERACPSATGSGRGGPYHCIHQARRWIWFAHFCFTACLTPVLTLELYRWITYYCLQFAGGAIRNSPNDPYTIWLCVEKISWSCLEQIFVFESWWYSAPPCRSQSCHHRCIFQEKFAAEART